LNSKNKKLLASLIVGICFIALGSGIFFYLKKSPGTLRYAYLWNEKVWSMVSSTKRLSVEKPAPRSSKEPRINGLLGLKSELQTSAYRILVDQPGTQIQLQLEDLKLFPKTSYATDFRCIEGWSEELQYAGVRFEDFLEKFQLGKKPDGSYYQYVGLETPDKEYYVSIDMESMLHPQTVLAYEMNLHPLSLKNGAPLRLVIPIKYGIKSLKRIGRIFFSDVRPRDYWAERGYDWYSGL
jgi:hypothetical protein